MSDMPNIPQPNEYLDPVTDLDDCYYYAVPKFLPNHHPSTRWLMSMIIQNRAEKVLRKMSTSPSRFCGTYYQLVDDPKVYWGKESDLMSVFHRKTILYLTIAAAGIFLGEDSFVEAMLNHRDLYDVQTESVNSVQYATHVQDTQNGDIHAFPMYVVMMRCCKFECALHLLRNGWSPLQPLAMPLRRLNERRAIYVADWLDYALWLVADRSNYPLSVLVMAMSRDPVKWRHTKMPIEQVTGKKKDADTLDDKEEKRLVVGRGFIDIEDLPPDGPRLLGVRSLAQLVKDYDKFRQARLLHLDAKKQMRWAHTALGTNPELLLAQCQDYNAAFYEIKSRNPNIGRNNSAQQTMIIDQVHYASEPVRILHYSLERDKHGKSLQQCIDAIEIYLRRKQYSAVFPMPAGSAQLRDVHNAVVLLLNLMQRQLDELTRLFCLAGLNTGLEKTKFVGDVRRKSCLRKFNRLVQTLLNILLHNKIFAEFAINPTFPPYPASEVDFPYANDLAQSYADIRMALAREFNVNPHQSASYLSHDMLKQLFRAARAGQVLPKALRLELRLGQPPKEIYEFEDEVDCFTACCKKKQSKCCKGKKKQEEKSDSDENSDSPKKARCCNRKKSNKKTPILSNTSKTANKSKKNENNYNISNVLAGLRVDGSRLPPHVTFIRVQPKTRGGTRALGSTAAPANSSGVRTIDLLPFDDYPAVKEECKTLSESFKAETEAQRWKEQRTIEPTLNVDEEEVAASEPADAAKTIELGTTADAKTAEATSQQLKSCQLGISSWLKHLGQIMRRRISRIAVSNRRKVCMGARSNRIVHSE